MTDKRDAGGASRKLAANYEVGYGKPPKDHQFKAGQPSANPRGRKRKLSPEAEARATLKRNLEDRITIRDGAAPAP